MGTLLSAEQIESGLRGLPGWHGDPDGIVREHTAEDFMAGIRLVYAVAEAAERAGHHPDIDIRWTTVTFSLTTHALGGVSQADLNLADRINRIIDDADGSGG